MVETAGYALYSLQSGRQIANIRLEIAPSGEHGFMRLQRLVRKSAREIFNRMTLARSWLTVAKNRRLAPPMVDPIWPLPRRADGPSDQDITTSFQKYNLWHYAFKFESGLEFQSHHNEPGCGTDDPDRPLQRFRHLMPWLLRATGGSLEGKRVLDIACNSGFWSIQCALLGAKEVVGFDFRQELVDQANLIKSIVGIENARFQVLDFWEMNPDALGGEFDVVLNLGILYHLPNPIEALELTRTMAREYILLDTAIFNPSPLFVNSGINTKDKPLVRLLWEEPTDIRCAVRSGIVVRPTKCSIEMMLRHAGCADWMEIPLLSMDMPKVYLTGRRASWLIRL